MIRYYLAQITGTGTYPDPFRPVVAALVPGLAWSMVDGRVNGTVATGWGCVQADVTAAQHATLLADPRVSYLPCETAGGALLTPVDPVSSISPANRSTIRALFAAQHIPDDGIALADPIRTLIQRARRRFLVRQILGVDDLTEGLDTLISAIAPARRAAIRGKLLARGIDFDGVLLTDTVREAIRKIVVQNRTSLS